MNGGQVKIRKGIGMACSKVLSHHLHVGTEENHNNLRQDSCCLSQDLILGPSEQKAGVLTIQLWYSVRIWVNMDWCEIMTLV
jgi:hypothetical protein